MGQGAAARGIGDGDALLRRGYQLLVQATRLHVVQHPISERLSATASFVSEISSPKYRVVNFDGMLSVVVFINLTSRKGRDGVGDHSNARLLALEFVEVLISPGR